MKNYRQVLIKCLAGSVLFANLAVLTSCSQKEETKEETKEEQDTIIESDGEIEIEVAEDEESFGE